MNLSSFSDHIKRHHEFGDAFAFYKHIAPKKALFGDSIILSPQISSAMKEAGINGLYSHQTEAIGHIRNRENVLVSTPTASGKSLIYNTVVTEDICEKGDSKALYIFPLKALEQDQMKNLATWLAASGADRIRAEIYDGDTSAYKRKKIRTSPPDILFTNPDMLHRAILSHHQAWEAFLSRLNFVVLDEVHTYRGIFGSHVNQVIGRLKRLCRHYGSDPRFILLSATVANPEQFGRSLIGEDVRVVESDGAPRAARHFLFLNPMSSANFSAARLFAECLKNGFRTIAFTQSRKVTELIHLWASQLLPRLKDKICSYRAGFMPEERRVIEKRLASGKLLGVVSTSALEMGIDIGSLDVCLLVGYPGTVINTWQRGGRVGRSGRESMVILVAKPDALDQYFMKYPEEFFGRSYESAVLDPNNPHVVGAHLVCAADEMPITLSDARYWPSGLEAMLERLDLEGRLQRTAEGEPMWFSSRRNPHRNVDLRSSGDTYTIFDAATGSAVGTVDGMRAFKECHPGAVYLHMARQYGVERLILDKRDIIVRPVKERYFTRARSEKDTEIIRTVRSRPCGQFLIREGELKVTEKVTGYEKRALPGQELLGVFDLDLPSQTFDGRGFWIEIEDFIKAYVEAAGYNFMGGIHAIEHAAIGIFPLFALCDRNDIGGICYPYHPQVGKSAIFIYDSYPGGVGLASRGYDIISELLARTLKLIRECECEDGCPSCIHSPKCGSGNKPLDKAAAVVIIDCLLGNIAMEEICECEVEEMPPLSTPVAEKGREVKPRVLYLDIETQRSAKEVGGWNMCHLMGVSVAVLYDGLEGRYHAFYEQDMDALFEYLEKGDLVVGFNIKAFDYKVLEAYSNGGLGRLPTFDILEDVYARLGYRLGLDHLASETLGKGKSADGLQALEWFKKGEMEKLTKYCRQDVRATRDLFLYGLEKGHLVYRKKGEDKKMRLLVDWSLEELLQASIP